MREIKTYSPITEDFICYENEFDFQVTPNTLSDFMKKCNIKKLQCYMKDKTILILEDIK